MIDQAAAHRIACEHLNISGGGRAEAVDGRSARVNVYGLREPVADCWVVYVPQPGMALRSSVVVVVSKGSGEVLYHGPANDEG